MWQDLFKIFNYALGVSDPLSKKVDNKNIPGAGIPSVDTALDLRNLESLQTGGAFIRVQNELVDMTTATNRTNRYKEYDMLVQSIAEVEMAMTVFADEACIAADTLIETVYYGSKSIEWLAKNKSQDKFPVYCYDFEKEDYTIGWAYSPRFVQFAETIQIALESGFVEIVTPDHKILKRNGEWVFAGDLQFGDELMPFYRIKANQYQNKSKINQFPRVFTFNQGWLHERQFIDEWRLGKRLPEYEAVNKISRLISGGLNSVQVQKLIGIDWVTIVNRLRRQGFSYKELKYLSKKENKRRVMGVQKWHKLPVYDLSVEKYENFCTENLVMHNCQKDEDHHAFKIMCPNRSVVEELETLFYSRDFLNLDQKDMWNKAKRLFIKGDSFWEIKINPDNPKSGILGLADLPAETMFRIETVGGRVIEFQQTKEAPDYQAILRAPIDTATDLELKQSTSIRFSPEQIIHIRIGDYRRTFYPYGISLIEPARGPAHLLRTMEDSMIVYRLCITGYVKIKTDVGWKYMKDIRPGDIVWTFNKDQKLEKSNVVWWVNNGRKPVFKIKSAHTEIKATETHPILTRDKITGEIKYTEARKCIPYQHQFIHPVDETEIPKKIERFVKEKYAYLAAEQIEKYKQAEKKTEKILNAIKLSGIELDKKILQKCWSFFVTKGNYSLPAVLAESLCDEFNLDKNKLNYKNKKEKLSTRINLPDYVNEEFAELLGFLYGDGYIDHENRGDTSGVLGFAAGDIPEINKKYENLLIKYFGKANFSQDKRKKQGIDVYRVNSATVCEIMENLGYKGDVYTKRVPDWMFNERKNIRRCFINGFVDADGEKRGPTKKTWNTTIRLVNKGLIEDIKELWESLGFHCSTVKEIEEKERYIQGKLVYSSLSYEIYISETKVNIYDDITYVEYDGVEEVYDIEVDNEQHNFVGNNVLLHNSRAPERRIFYIDVAQLPPHKAEAFVDRIKDQFRKKKVPQNRFAQGGPSSVEEKFHVPAVDEDYWVPTRPNSATKIDTLPGACLDLNTKIPLLDGRILKLSEIIKEHESGKQNWVYSCNPQNGEPVPGLISWAGITRRNTQVVKITLDNGEIITCTPDHNFPVIGKGKVQAKDLEIGESLIAFNTRLEDLRPNRPTKYLQVYDKSKKDWIFVHRMAAQFLKNTKFEKSIIYNEKYKNNPRTIVHHVDYNHFNNNPENLAWMDWDDHKLLHRENQHVTNAHISEALKQYHENLSLKEKKERDKTLSELSVLGTNALGEKLENDPIFKQEFIKKQKEGWDNSKLDNPELHEKRGQKITERNNEFWSNPENKKIVFDKQTIVYPQELFDFVINAISQNITGEEVVKQVKENAALIKLLNEANTHIKRDDVVFENVFSMEHIRKMLKIYGYNSIRDARKKLGGHEDKSGRPKLPWPKKVIDEFMALLKQDKNVEEILGSINGNKILIDMLAESGHAGKFSRNLMNKMLKSFGYTGLKHAKEQAQTYNHRVVSIEYLEEKIDTGTITVDGHEELHNYHTFAISTNDTSHCGIWTYNSNLGEIDDTIYFRNKLFTALNFPKNYFSLEDPNATRITLSAQDVKFARLVERLQSYIEEGLYQVGERHLRLRGFPPESYEKLIFKMTPPSDWRELSRAEIVTNRINNANSYKGSQLMSDYDIYIEVLRYPEEKAKEMLARLKVQKLEDLKLQILAQNPTWLGVGMPGQHEQEIGSEPGGPNPNLGPPQEPTLPGQEQPPGGQPPQQGPPMPPPPQDNDMIPPAEQGKPLPEPTESEIIKYDLEIEDYESEQDYEEIDPTEDEI